MKRSKSSSSLADSNEEDSKIALLTEEIRRNNQTPDDSENPQITSGQNGIDMSELIKPLEEISRPAAPTNIEEGGENLSFFEPIKPSFSLPSTQTRPEFFEPIKPSFKKQKT
ncbi:MAG: hypothetical protein SFV53_03045 [Rickettsiales bacterium]|nr:hypothetical protein [Rickettsiales bacterium]